MRTFFGIVILLVLSMDTMLANSHHIHWRVPLLLMIAIVNLIAVVMAAFLIVSDERQ